MLATRPDAVLRELSDVVTLTELHDTHGISIDCINATILMTEKHKPYTPFIYVVYYHVQIMNIIDTEIMNPDTDFTGFKIVDSLMGTDTDIFYFVGEEENSALPRDKFNLGISFIFICKRLTSPLIKTNL